jgi:hypothetical protein
MERDIITIVARQLKEAQDKHAKALRIVERIERTLNRRLIILAEKADVLINIEEIHNNLPE